MKDKIQGTREGIACLGTLGWFPCESQIPTGVWSELRKALIS